MTFSEGADRESGKWLGSDPVGDLRRQKQELLISEVREKGANNIEIGRYRQIFRDLLGAAERKN